MRNAVLVFRSYGSVPNAQRWLDLYTTRTSTYAADRLTVTSIYPWIY